MDASAAPAGGNRICGDVGPAIAAARKASRLTQAELARQASISVSLLRKIEQGTRSLTPGVKAALTSALGTIPAQHGGESPPGRIASALPLLREMMDRYDIPADPAPRPLTELRSQVSTATAWRLASRYAELAGLLPGLLSELTTMALTSTGHEQEQAYGLLALAYRAADAIADKRGCHDMSARAVELTRWAASHSGDPLLQMMAAYVRAELFFTGSHAQAGLLILDNVAGPAPPDRSVTRLAMYGALHMRAAVLAARAGMPEAAERIAEARAAAQRIPDGIYHGTAFGPSSVRVHELAAAVESCDITQALRLASRWQPPQALPAERRSHFYIEAARAHHLAGHPDQATTAIWQARRTAPQHTRYNPAVSETIEALVLARRRPPQPLLQLASWVGVTHSGRKREP
jgi:transcriptional regulator with XRE-family HTH domain